MTLAFLEIAIALLVVTGLAAFFVPERRAVAISASGAVVAGAIGAAASFAALLAGEVASAKIPWSVPLGELHVGVDPLSSLFLVSIFALSALSAAYGAAYLASSTKRGRRQIGCTFNVLVASMAAVVLARDGVFFLFAWELMSIASFLLVRFEEGEEVERASFVYLVASHLGTAFLFVLVTLLAARAGTFDLTELLPPGGGFASVCFLLALVGFGTKAGLWPLHVWLPEAHPAAPSHVSAVMSAVMVKIGVYGILRTITLLGPPPPWWGIVVLVLGGISAFAGVLHALGSRDLKRLLAYSTIENVGIVCLGIGLGLVGLSGREPAVAFLGFAGALLHVLSHGVFKTVLFHAAGGVLHATGSRDLESMGGLLRRLPATGGAFLAGSLAASAVPPLGGFVGEWVIFLAAFEAALGEGPIVGAGLAVIALLALVGGLAAACFVRAFGIAFLGEPRSRAASESHGEARGMTVPMWIGAAASLAIGVLPAALLHAITPAVALLAGRPETIPAEAALGTLGAAVLMMIAVAMVVVAIRSRLLSDRDVRTAPTWDCGYASPTARMQYTAASFAGPALEPFAGLVRTRVAAAPVAGTFPVAASHETAVVDDASLFALGAARAAGRTFARVTALQLGRIQIYLLYVFVTLVALLLWWLPW